MMKQDKLKKVDIKSFLISVAILFVTFAVVTLLSVKDYIEETYATIEKYSLGLADSYTRRISNSNAATEVITELVEKKLLATGEIMLQLDDRIKSADLTATAERYALNEINIYNKSGEVINSTTTSLIGWKTYEGHPVHNFIISAQESFTEDTRINVVSGGLYKYAYVKRKDGSVVQIGILAEQINTFLESFSIQRLIDDFIESDLVENIFFTDSKYNLVASGTKEHAAISFDAEDIHDHFMANEAKVGKNFAKNGKLHVCAPVFYAGEKLGTLTVVWSSKLIITETNRIIIESIYRFLIITLLLCGVLFYAYRKRKLSVEVAFYDGLTGLPNDNYLKEYLSHKIKNCVHDKTAVLLLNLSNFNLVNLTHGFDYGDTVLQQVVKIYSNHLSSKDMLFRMDADKFVMVMNRYDNILELKNRSKRILEDFKNPAINTHRHAYLSLKIVIYELHDPHFSVGRVLHDASLGMGTFKSNASKDTVVFAHSMRNALLREEAIEKTLISIIAGEHKDRLHMHYQPLLGVQSNKILGFEALARLTISGIGQVSPAEFIDIAERRNLIFPLGNVILKESSEFLRQLKDSGHTDAFVSINISGLQLLRDEFLNTVKKLMNIPFEDGRNLVFEITESVLVDNFEITNKNLKELRKLGILIALDDFGTGYSSLAELRNMDIDILKIDRAFVDKIGQNDLLITQDIIAMAHKLDLKVVAEGVESELQMSYLTAHGCDVIQGYYISKPLSGHDAIAFLKRHKAKKTQNKLSTISRGGREGE
ncbi:MAG: putative bifunctional diguanylate cyclase/phosphodiesterase [Oscillospiraceae bacterium]